MTESFLEVSSRESILIAGVRVHAYIRFGNGAVWEFYGKHSWDTPGKPLILGMAWDIILGICWELQDSGNPFGNSVEAFETLLGHISFY